LPKWLAVGWENGYLGDWAVDALVGMASRLDFQTAWEFHHYMWVYGVATPADVLRQFERYALPLPDSGQPLSKLSCPVMVTGAADTLYFSPDMSTNLI
jgi:hypothetical protein